MRRSSSASTPTELRTSLMSEAEGEVLPPRVRSMYAAMCFILAVSAIGVRRILEVQFVAHTHCVGVLRTRESIDLSCWDMQQTETSNSRVREATGSSELNHFASAGAGWFGCSRNINKREIVVLCDCNQRSSSPRHSCRHRRCCPRCVTWTCASSSPHRLLPDSDTAAGSSSLHHIIPRDSDKRTS